MRGAIHSGGALPRVTGDAVLRRAARLTFEHDPNTPRDVRAMLAPHLDEIRTELARKLQKGLALWECAVLLAPPQHPLRKVMGADCALMEREDLADLFASAPERSRAVMAAPEDHELRLVVFRNLLADRRREPSGNACVFWTGPLWVFEGNDR